MKIKIDVRRSGKTTEAVKLANETGAYLVVRSKADALRISKEHECDRFPVTFDELLQNKMAGSFVRNIVIDSADAFLEHALPGAKIEGITLTKGEQ